MPRQRIPDTPLPVADKAVCTSPPEARLALNDVIYSTEHYKNTPGAHISTANVLQLTGGI